MLLWVRFSTRSTGFYLILFLVRKTIAECEHVRTSLFAPYSTFVRHDSYLPHRTQQNETIEAGENHHDPRSRMIHGRRVSRLTEVFKESILATCLRHSGCNHKFEWQVIHTERITRRKATSPESTSELCKRCASTASRWRFRTTLHCVSLWDAPGAVGSGKRSGPEGHPAHDENHNMSGLVSMGSRLMRGSDAKPSARSRRIDERGHGLLLTLSSDDLCSVEPHVEF